MKNLFFSISLIIFSAHIFADDTAIEAADQTTNYYNLDNESNTESDNYYMKNDSEDNFDNYYTNNNSEKRSKGNLVFIEYKASYFRYQDHSWRKIFSDAAFMSIFGLDIKAHKKFHAWTDVGLLFDKGEVKKANFQTTKLKFIPVSFGLKFVQPVGNSVNLYAKIGPNWFYCKSKTAYPYVSRKDTKKGWGATMGVGTQAYIFYNFSADFFFDYLFCKKRYLDHNSNFRLKTYIGGFAIGGGLGYNF